MPQPPAYARSTDFAEDERDNVGGRSTVLTAEVNAELDAIQATLTQTLTNLALNQRDDGEIRDGRVKLFTLASDVLALLTSYSATPRGSWVTATQYNLKDLVSQSGNTYICVTAHVSGVFATDLAAGKWLLFSLSTAPGAAQVTFTPAGGVAATNVQAAIAEVDSEYRVADTVLQGNINTVSSALTSLIADLLSAVNAAKGAGQIGFNPTLNYAVGTLGYSEKAIVHIRQFSNFVGDGVADDTAAVQGALDFMANTRGKGVLEAEGCRIRLTAKLTIPSHVLFRGAAWLPDPSNGTQAFHTALYIDWGSGADNHAIEMSHSSGIEGFTIYYPGQVAKTAATPTAFGFAISTPTAAGVYDNIHIKNITLYNAYKGIRLISGGRWRVENIQGDPLFLGFTADQCLDVCYMSSVHFWNFYTQSNTLETWVAANATAFEFRRVDQFFGDKLFAWNRNIGFHFRDSFWGQVTGMLVDKANYPVIVEQATQLTVDGFVLICNATVRPAIWGRFIGESARFANGRITDAAGVGVQIDDGNVYQFDNVDFDCPHSALVNLSSTTEVRVSDTCRWNVPPFGMWNTYLNGERLPKTDTAITLGSVTLTGTASAISGGYRFPLDAIGTSSAYWDLTLIGQRCSLYVLEFDWALNGSTLATTWYFQFLVAKDTGSSVITSFAPTAPLILNVGSVGRRVRIPFHINHARNKTVVRIQVQATAGTVGASLDITNIVLYEQASANTTDSQIGNMMRATYCLDPYGKGQTLTTKGKARRIITEPEAGVGRAGATPTAGVWAVGDEVLLDTPVAGGSPGVVCTTAGDFSGVAPVFKALPNLAA